MLVVSLNPTLRGSVQQCILTDVECEILFSDRRALRVVAMCLWQLIKREMVVSLVLQFVSHCYCLYLIYILNTTCTALYFRYYRFVSVEFRSNLPPPLAHFGYLTEGGKFERFWTTHDGMTSGARRRRENFEKTPIFIGFRLRNRIISHRAHSKFDKTGAQIYARARIPDISNPRISYQGGG